MKLYSIINPYKAMVEQEMLEETRLSTAFKIGFELEGICDSNIPELRNSGYLPSYHSNRRPSDGAKALLDKLNDMLGMGKGSIINFETNESTEIDYSTNTFNIKGIKGTFSLDDGTIYYRYTSDSDIKRIGDVSENGKLQFDQGEADAIAKTYNLKNFKLPVSLAINSSKIESDGSLSASGTNSTGHAWTFEWGSPIINFNPKNVDKIYKFLTGLKDIGVYTNDSCGFHTHISFEDMTRDDAKWILFCIANDETLLNEVTYLNVPGEKSVQFFGHYADDKWFRQLKAHGNLKDWSFRSDTNDKYLQMRMHPGAGTLEWRGPRNFINDGEKPQMIKEYLMKLWKLILKIGKLVDEKEYNGYKKSDVLAKMVVTGQFNTTAERLSSMNADKLYHLILDKPITMVSLKPSKLKAVLEKYGSRIINSSMNSINFKTAWSKMSIQNKEIVVKWSFESGNFGYLISLCTGDDGKLDAVTSELLIKIGKNHVNSLKSLLDSNLDKLTINKPELIEMIYNSGLPLNNILKVLSKFPNLINLKILAEIANSKNRYILGNFPKLPVKIQRILIRKSPYNIQYINNPDQSIINELKKKYGEDLNDYILGVL